eukprot:RCo036512
MSHGPWALTPKEDGILTSGGGSRGRSKRELKELSFPVIQPRSGFSGGGGVALLSKPSRESAYREPTPTPAPSGAPTTSPALSSSSLGSSTSSTSSVGPPSAPAPTTAPPPPPPVTSPSLIPAVGLLA